MAGREQMAGPRQTTAIRILLADAHPVVREGLTRLLSQHDDFDVVGIADSAEAAIFQAELLQPEVAIIDSSFLTSDSRDVSARIRTVSPTTRCIIHSASATRDRIADTASVEVVKQLHGDQLARTIRSVAHRPEQSAYE